MADFLFFGSGKTNLAINVDAIRAVELKDDGGGRIVFAPDHVIEMDQKTMKEFIDVITRFKSTSASFMDQIRKVQKEVSATR